MSTDNRSFIFNLEWMEVLKDYPKEVRYEVLDAIIGYAQSGALIEMKPLAKMAFSFIKREMDFNKCKYEDTKRKRSDAGRKGMEARYGNKQVNSDVMSEVTNVTEPNKDNKANNVTDVITEVTSDNKSNYNVYVNDNVNVDVIKENSKKKTAKRFSPPTIEEVQAYVEEKGYNVDAVRFVNFYAAKGWMIGKNKMQNWKSAVATWQRGENENGNQRKQADGGFCFGDNPAISRPTGEADDGAGRDEAQQPPQDYSERF